jgi:hypothetical protein
MLFKYLISMGGLGVDGRIILKLVFEVITSMAISSFPSGL